MLYHVIKIHKMIFECLHSKTIETTSQNLQLVPPACRSIPRASGPSSLARSPSKGSNSVRGCEPTCIHCNSPDVLEQYTANAEICFSICMKNWKTQFQIFHDISYKNQNEGPLQIFTCLTAFIGQSENGLECLF